MRHVIVIGAGASGLVAAISAAKEGAKVTLIEQNDRVGKKILSTGNGRCNLTNLYMDVSCFHGDDLTIVKEVLSQFDETKTCSFFEELGVFLHDRNGYVYPFSDQASTILDVLRLEVEKMNINLLLSQSVTKISKIKKGYSVQTTEVSIQGDCVILATGGKASKVLGSDGSGYTLAKSLGHQLSPVVPALVQLIGKNVSLKSLSGVRCQANVSLFVDNELITSDHGELQLTDYGISGIPVFQVSRFAAKAIYERKYVYTEIDFLPQISLEKLQLVLKDRLLMHGQKNAESYLIGILNKKLIVYLLKEAGINIQETANKVAKEKWNLFATLCKKYRVEIADTKGFDSAQICAGGVKTTEVNPKTMESLCEHDLYLTGELLDIDGICGGYNLQWAWSTGYIAGKNAAKGN